MTIRDTLNVILIHIVWLIASSPTTTTKTSNNNKHINSMHKSNSKHLGRSGIVIRNDKCLLFQLSPSPFLILFTHCIGSKCKKCGSRFVYVFHSLCGHINILFFMEKYINFDKWFENFPFQKKTKKPLKNLRSNHYTHLGTLCNTFW